jgi:hypothetical protein
LKAYESIAQLGGAMQKRDEGRYRTEASEDRGPMAYVVHGGRASYISEAAYRAKRYSLAFEDLPTEADYDSSRT